METTEFKTSDELKNKALDSLKGNKLNAIAVCLIATVIPLFVDYSIDHPGLQFIVHLLISGPLTVGLSAYFLALIRNQQPKINTFMYGLQNAGGSVYIYLLMTLYIVCWSLLFVIPGIIKAMSYSMAYYIKCDHPELSTEQAIDASMQMMDGHKLRLFFLVLSFIGWLLLSLITLGLAFIFILPYYDATIAAFYIDIKEKQAIRAIEAANVEQQPV